MIGLLSETKDNETAKHFLMRFLGKSKYEIYANEANPFEMGVLCLPYTEKQLVKLRPLRLEMVIDNATRQLKVRGAERIVLSEPLYNACRSAGLAAYEPQRTERRRVFFELVPELVRKAADDCGLNTLEALICINDLKMGGVGERLIRALCYDTKRLVLCTQMRMKAERFCEEFYDDTGLSVSVSDRYVNKTDILIDIDNDLLRIGKDLYVVGADFGFDFGDYRVNPLDAVACSPPTKTERVTCVYNYSKKTLTL